jgi:hypothetical protein
LHPVRGQIDFQPGLRIDALHSLGDCANAVAAAHVGQVQFDHTKVSCSILLKAAMTPLKSARIAAASI